MSCIGGRIKRGEIRFLEKVAERMEFLLRNNKEVIYLDTTNRNPEELVDSIVNEIF